MTRLTRSALALGLAVIAVTGSAAAAGGLYTRHQVSGLPVSVALPASWQSVSVPASVTPAVVKHLAAADPTAVMFNNPYLAHAGIRFIGNEPGRQGHFGANVNLIVKPLPPNLTLRAWFFSGASSAMQYVGTTTAISRNGAAGLHYRSTKVQKYGTVPLLTDIYAFAHAGRVFDFTYTALASDASTYLPTFMTSARSIRLDTH